MQDPQMSRPWFVARLQPGAASRAPDRFGTPQWRWDECVAERSLRDNGFSCYMPKMRRQAIHRRTNRLIIKSYPLFFGYAFVDKHSIGGVRAKDCDGVAEILGERLDGRPWPVPARMVHDFMAAEADLAFDDTPEARQRRNEEGRNSRETLTMRFPVGETVRVMPDDHPLGGFHGLVTGITGRGMVRIMMTLFQGQVPVEIAPEVLEAA